MTPAGTEGSRGWRWRPKEAESHEGSPPVGDTAGSPFAGPGRLLLYEPGNRGDLLKAGWLVPIAEALAPRPDDPVLDLCAGAPSYPLTAGARSRRERAPAEVRSALETAGGEEAWPSSGFLLRHLRGVGGAPAPLRVFDRVAERREAWRSVPGVEVLRGEDGIALLGSVVEGSAPPALVLVDPYDLFHRWGAWREGIRLSAAVAPVLIYLYNKSPRGVGHLDQYRRLRDALTAVGPEPPCIGRLASDRKAPRALHEVWLFAHGELRARLVDPLRAMTERLVECFPGEAGFPAFVA